MNPGLQAFILFQVLFVAIGLASVRRRKKTPTDYLVAGRSLGPWTIGLSAVSTCCSGFMFIGLMGLVYRLGVVAAWLVPGAVLGNWAIWRFFVPLVERNARAGGALTIPGFLSPDSAITRKLIAVVMLVFLGLYAAAQLTAGSKALSVLFDMNLAVGALLGAGMIVLYCVSGGLRASVWTDVAQSVVMWVAMAVLLGVCLSRLGGVEGLVSTLAAKDAALVNWQASSQGPLIAFNWVLIGLGLLGQPQVMIRGMALAGPREAARARRVYVAYYATFMAMAVAVGLCCRALLDTGAGLGDAELALPLLAERYASPLLLGLVLAGTFSASVSTADSQVLACSAALSQDLTTRYRDSYLATKIATLLVTAVALAVALTASRDVYTVILFAWSLLAVSLGPLMVCRCFGWRLRPYGDLAVVLAGGTAALIWRFGASTPGGVSEILIGGLVGLVIADRLRQRDAMHRDKGPHARGV